MNLWWSLYGELKKPITWVPQAVIIERVFPWKKTEGSQTVQATIQIWQNGRYRTWTCDPLINGQMLLPTELISHIWKHVKKQGETCFQDQWITPSNNLCGLLSDEWEKMDSNHRWINRLIYSQVSWPLEDSPKYTWTLRKRYKSERSSRLVHVIFLWRGS